jgi:hypothetical protein
MSVKQKADKITESVIKTEIWRNVTKETIKDHKD